MDVADKLYTYNYTFEFGIAVKITTSNNGLWFAIETAVRHQDVVAGVESEGIAEGSYGEPF